MGEFYSRFVPSESVSYPCGEPLQTHNYIIRDCLLYEHHHPLLWKVSRTLYIPDILEKREGILALAEFLEKSNVLIENDKNLPSRAIPSVDNFPLEYYQEGEPEED
jgi:hypothetical protein